MCKFLKVKNGIFLSKFKKTGKILKKPVPTQKPEVPYQCHTRLGHPYFLIMF